MKRYLPALVIGVCGLAFLVLVGILIYQDSTEKQVNYNATLTNTTVNSKYKFPGVLPDDQIKGKKAVIETAKGKITIELLADDAPKTVSNFVYLTKEGLYNGLKFHRREEGFVIQGGDPNGDGTGGPGYEFEDEAVKRDYDRGIVAMANSGANTNGSQFFIMLADNKSLPKKYTIFGKVTSGMEVADKIAVGDVMTSVTIE